MNDVSINIPVELFDSFSLAIRTGLNKSKLSPDEKQQLENWWNAENEFINDEIDQLKKYD